ncbi:MAG: 50S ribosomal protein L33 [Patescibacteria group bacterium]|nr:50S ribosomal protein L33 [Patescibacteria group bacterium]
MSQDNLIKLVSLGDKSGKGKGHIIWSHKNTKKLRGIKIELKKFNPIAKKHTVYREKKS